MKEENLIAWLIMLSALIVVVFVLGGFALADIGKVRGDLAQNWDAHGHLYRYVDSRVSGYHPEEPDSIVMTVRLSREAFERMGAHEYVRFVITGEGK